MGFILESGKGIVFQEEEIKIKTIENKDKGKENIKIRFHIIIYNTVLIGF